MRNFLMAAVAVTALMSASVAMADEFNSPQQEQGGVNAYLDNQATDAQLADPTAPNSLRSHGHP